MKNLNPDLQRYLWEEFTLKRVITGIAIAVLIATFILATRSGLYRGGSDVIMVCAFFCVIFAGAKVCNTVPNEMAYNTWPLHQMSSLSPWSLVWGKMLGAGSFWLMMAFIFALINILIIWDQSITFSNYPWRHFLTLLFFTFFCINAGFWLSLGSSGQQKSKKRQSSNNIIFFVFILLSLPLLSYFFSNNSDTNGIISFAGNNFDHLNFININLLIFSAWLMLANVRLMRIQLEIPQFPWATPLFILFLSGWVSGLVRDGASWGLFFLLNLLIAGLLVYVGLIFEPPIPLVFKQLRIFIQKHRYRDAIKNIPLWLVMLVFAAVSMVLFYLTTPTEFYQSSTNLLNSPIFALLFVLLLVRDTFIFLICHHGNHRRSLFTAIVVLVVLEYMLPHLFAALDAGIVSTIIFPLYNFGEASFSDVVKVLIMLVQILIAGGWYALLVWKHQSFSIKST